MSVERIKFTHEYDKLKDVDFARLLDVLPIDLKDLSVPFRNYDTDDGVYKLPKKGEYLLLIFEKIVTYPSCKARQLFTTIRRRTVTKESYYRSRIGKLFSPDYQITERSGNVDK